MLGFFFVLFCFERNVNLTCVVNLGNRLIKGKEQALTIRQCPIIQCSLRFVSCTYLLKHLSFRYFSCSYTRRMAFHLFSLKPNILTFFFFHAATVSPRNLYYTLKTLTSLPGHWWMDRQSKNQENTRFN